MPISHWKTTSTHNATWSLRLWICALVVPFSGQKRLISPVGSSLIIQYPCADYTRGVVSLYGERTPGVLIPLWTMTPTRHAIRSHRWWMYAFAMSCSGRKGESFSNVKYLQLDSSHVMRYLSAGYKKGTSHNMIKKTPVVLFSCCTMAHSDSHGELFYYIMKELRPGVLISRWKLTPTKQAIRSHR